MAAALRVGLCFLLQLATRSFTSPITRRSTSFTPLLLQVRGGGTARVSTMTTTTEAPTPSPATTTTHYTELLKELDAITQLERVSTCLNYDKLVFMPTTGRAAKERGKQSAALASIIHEKSIDPKIGSLLDAAHAEVMALDDDDDDKKEKLRNIEIARKSYEKQVCIPTELAAKQAALSSEAYNTWAKSRQADDFSMFSNVLGRCIALAIEVAQCKRQKLGGVEGEEEAKSIYATMLDEYEVGMDPARIDAIFAEIKSALVPLIEKVLSNPDAAPSTAPLQGSFSVEQQKELCNQLVRAIGYNDANGRIDVSTHPMTMPLHSGDVRITTRFSETEWHQGLVAMIHESGHAIYEQNIKREDDGNDDEYHKPVDSHLSMGMHESQSLFWERHVGKSLAFWKYATPIVNEKLGVSYTPEELYGAINVAKKSLIRVEADELTYPLHVILRYEIERDFVEGKLSTADIPSRWNAEIESMLGLQVPSDAKGCLQDIHWAMLAYGYFPTYLLGGATAAQLFYYCQQDIPDMQEQIEQGQFLKIREWLTEKVHKHGKRYHSLDEHLEAQLGEKLNPKYFIDYLTNKYTELYKC